MMIKNCESHAMAQWRNVAE